MFAADPLQFSLFGTGEPRPDPGFTTLERVSLDPESWLDHAPGWLSGDAALFDVLVHRLEWRQPVVQMYERLVRTPRLVATVDRRVHPAIEHTVELLSDRYQVKLDRVTAGWYRDGSDSVAWHGDRIARDRPRSTVATVSLGGPRRFLIRPVGGGGSLRFDLGTGDLMVMGGASQRLWEHSVPKTASAPPRIAVMFRHAYD